MEATVPVSVVKFVDEGYLVGSEDGKVRCHDMTDKEVIWEKEYPAGLCGIEMSDDFVVVGSRDGTLTVETRKDPKIILTKSLDSPLRQHLIMGSLIILVTEVGLQSFSIETESVTTIQAGDCHCVTRHKGTLYSGWADGTIKTHQHEMLDGGDPHFSIQETGKLVCKSAISAMDLRWSEFTPSFLVVGGDDGSIMIWYLDDDKIEPSFSGHRL